MLSKLFELSLPAKNVFVGDKKPEKVKRLEAVIAEDYDINVHELWNWYRDSEAKIMMCFVLIHYMNYVPGSVAKVYKINHHFMMKRIVDLYQIALLNKGDLDKISKYRSLILKQ